ncbi:MAG: S8 family serine peptidase, partial [Candidatus Hydrogenedentes bacterium]|nr:S8 family serine peptidase [Candidatus Hydrogenedentota bacterium]
PGYVAWLGAEGLSGGENITVHVVDDGLDKGIATNLPGTAHADILGRIVGIYNATSDADGACRTGHGQIDAAIIVGNATVGTVDKGGYLLGQGIAPQASVYATKIFRDEGEGTDIGSHTYTELMKLGQDAGAIISNHSWGAPVDGAYTATSAEFDALVRDSDSIEAGNQQILYFFCAGNDGPDTGTTWSNANAKNVVSVGSHENSDADGYDGGNFGPMHADNIRDLSPGSSRGPTDDGRLGVTVVATGTHVQGAATTVNGYTGAHVSDKYWPLNQQDYARSSGTSHASPIACGAGIVVYEMFRDQLSALGHTDTPCPALIRAVLTNTATDIVGGSDGNGGVLANIPNVHQGWGAVNLDRLASMKTSLYSLNQTQVFTASGQNFEVTLAPMIAGKPMKITLAWTDVPGIPGAGTELVNDLDLRVIQGGQTFKGNVFSDGSSTTGGNADRKNTLEAVYLDAPSGAPVTVRVSAFNIAGDGIPNMGGALDQDFALFAWNAGAPSSTGDVNIFPAEINCDQEVTINLRDQDLAATALASVTVTSSTGDVEEVLLGETDSGTGLFTATFATNTGTPATNGMLEVAHNGSLTVTYDDANNANGQQVSDEAVVLVDCTPPIVSEVQVSNITSTSALISYSTNGPCDSKVRFGTACGTLSQFRGGGLHSVEHKAHLTGLTASTTYRFKIDASDTAGNMITAEDSGSCFSFATTAQPDYFTERFGADDNDIANQTLLFTPDGSVSHYGVCRTAATSFPTDPSAHTNLSSTVGLKNDSSYQVTLTDGKEFPIYGMSFTSFFINANGNITFGSPDSSAIEIVQDHYAIPRVAGLYDDLAPTNQKPVRYMQLSDRAVITWDRVPEEGLGGSNSFQVELFFDGQIRLTHLNIDATDGLVGLSRGLGTQSDWIESNMNAYAGCRAQTGSLLVQIRPKSARQDGARWRVDGGAWTKHNKSVSGLAAGSHTIEFKPIPGWHEPNDKQVNVAAGDETVTSGKYNAEK